ncbi:MAG: cytochrome c [Pseudomonadota bacterium]|nr:cytochrome c [Pseudomonadota bacterium]
MFALKIRTVGFLALAGLSTAIAVSAGHAQRSRPDPAALVDQRQARMKALGGSMKTLTGFAKGERTAADARKAAAVLSAARDMHRWWPQGTAKGAGDSKASPAIWTDKQRFAQRVAEYRQAAAAMDKAARSGDAAQVRAQLPALGASCKSCHTAFQLKD